MSTYRTGNQTRLDIINAAKELFYEKGYVNTTTSEICKLANVNRGLLFYHFNNSRSDVKAYLGLRVYSDAVQQCYDETEPLLVQNPGLEKELGGLMFWHKFFNDDKYARFMMETAQFDTFQLSPLEYDLTFKIAANHEKDIDYNLRVALAMGADRNLTIYLYNHRDEYTPIFAYNMAQKIFTDFGINHLSKVGNISDIYNSDEFAKLEIKYTFL